jgi:selenium metabolism protein YedF
MFIVDALGKLCPQPVIHTKKALEEHAGDVQVIVDNAISKENVERFAKSQGCDVKTEEKENHFYINITRGQNCEIMDFKEEKSQGKNIVFYIASDHMGIGSEELGQILIRGFVKTIKDLKEKPGKLIFINGGVRLTTKDSKVLEDLEELETTGMEILSCGTCLDFFGLKEDLKVGRVSNMFEILSSLTEADRIVRP